MKWHRLKTHPVPLAEVEAGRKTFEFRRDDRGFEQGDKVILYYFDPETGREDYARNVVADVGYVLRGPAYGIPEGFCVFSLLDACTPRGLIRRVSDGEP